MWPYFICLKFESDTNVTECIYEFNACFLYFKLNKEFLQYAKQTLFDVENIAKN